MRKARSSGRNKKGSCVGGLIRFVIFLVLLMVGAKFLVGTYFDMDIPTKIKRIQYPIKYEFFVEKYADEYKLDKNLVYAVMRTESRFDKFAVSSAGAKGLMQLTDETGAECARGAVVMGYTPSALFDPEINIKLGCYYLRKLIDVYKSEINALAAYNGGPGNVDKWLADASNINNDGELVNIPFKETKNYVKRVLEARDMYQTIYGE